MWKAISLILFLCSCAVGTDNFRSRYSPDLEGRNVRRIAVLPPEPRPPTAKTRRRYGPAPEPAAKGREEEAAATLSHQIHATMAAYPRWQVVPEREVREAAPLITAGSEQSRVRRLGVLVQADAVVSTRVLRYRERVGEEWGVKSPASVSFVIEMWDAKRGDIVWSGQFDETQRALSDNILALREFSRRGARWLKAEELALEGVKKAVADLHQTLYRGTS